MFTSSMPAIDNAYRTQHCAFLCSQLFAYILHGCICEPSKKFVAFFKLAHFITSYIP